MKQFFKMFFASLLAMIVAGVIIIGLVVGLAVRAINHSETTHNVSLHENTILFLNLDKDIHEQSEKNSFASLSNDVSYRAGLYELTNAIKAAKTDDNVKGILIRTNGTTAGWATCEALHDALVDFKQSKKKIYVYGEQISQKDYYIASAADVLYLNPVGNLEFKGLAAELSFYKGTLDKLGIVPEIFYAGKFKSATEPFRASEMSEANKEQLLAVINGFWTNFLNAAVDKSKTDVDTINNLVQRGAIRFPSDALAARLVNATGYKDELETLMRKDLGLDSTEKVPYLNINEYAEHIDVDGPSEKDRIAVLFAEGEIVDGKGSDYQVASEDFVKSIRSIRDNKRIKAVVLRINSPGGSGLASEVILRELELLHAQKPIIVSMGDLAASGGYYIACASDSIFAQPNTITGSIGVFGMLFDLSPLLRDKVGVTFDGVKNAPYADFPTVSRPLTADEQVRMQQSIDTFYHIFKTHVAQSRNMNVDAVDSIAQGRIWTGTDALRLGLVDGLGNLDRALASAAKKAGLKDYSVLTYPDKVDRFRDVLMSSAMKRFNGSASASVIGQVINDQVLNDELSSFRYFQWLRSMNGKVLMAMPALVDIR